MGTLLTRAYVALVALICVVSLIYVYAFPPASMQTDRDGIPHFTPQVEHPETGEAINMGALVRHFRGD